MLTQCHSDQISRDNIVGSDDKENAAPAPPTQQDLPNPKKRAKVAATAPTAPVPTVAANTKTARTTSRATRQAQAPPPRASTVLSPKSHNSRTLPRSPIKAPIGISSPYKYTSPAKPPTLPIANATGGRTASRAQVKTTTKRQAARQQENVGRSSEASDTSAATATTIVTKAAPTKGRAAAAKKAVGAVVSKVGSIKKGANAKKENVPPAAATRSLRKRG